jgi:hypothetical protein
MYYQYSVVQTGRTLEGDRREIGRRLQGGCKEGGMAAGLTLNISG